MTGNKYRRLPAQKLLSQKLLAINPALRYTNGKMTGRNPLSRHL
jgi:hypothetical protein